MASRSLADSTRRSQRLAQVARSRAGAADEIVGDDLLSRSVSQSPTERKKVEDWAHASFLSRRKAEVGRAVLIGTSQHPDDYLAHARAAGDWVVCHMNLLNDGPDVYASLIYPDDVDHRIASANLSRVRSWSQRREAVPDVRLALDLATALVASVALGDVLVALPVPRLQPG
jgi:hypothetical protein